MFAFLKKLDLFAKRYPTFNIKGNESVHTYFGGFTSICLYMIVLIIAMVKMERLVLRRNPQINKYESLDDRGKDDIFDTTQGNFAIAFGLIDFMTGKPKHDPRYIRYHAVYWKSIDSVIERRLVPIYPCKAADIARLLPDRNEDSIVKHLREEGAMQCIDWKTANFEIFGNTDLPSYGGLDILVTPCNVAWPIPREKGGTDQGVREDCEWDQTKGSKYIFDEGTNLVVMSNVSRF